MIQQGTTGSIRQDSGSGTIRVLVVDDDRSLADLVVRTLERELDAIQATAVYDAEAGLDHLRSSPVDCIVSDYQMHGMDGLAFLEAVREGHPDLPFILFTGKGSEEVAVDAIRVGATDYLQKRTGDQFHLLANRILNAVSEYRATRAERHLRELAENTDRILYIFTHDWSELLFVSPVYEEIWGRSVETLRENPADFLNGIHPEDRDMVREAMETMTAGGSITIEYRVNEAEEFGRWVRVKGEPITDDDGRVVRVAGFATEITDEKRREQELEYQRTVLESVIETVPNGILVVDEDREFFTYNERFVEMWDVPADVVESGDGERALESVLDRLEDPDRFLERVEYFYDHPEEESEDLIQLADGRTFERYTAPVPAPDGTDFGRVWIFQDVTDREARERELEQQNERLERQNERLEDFVSIASHDLRTPLTVATGHLELAAEQYDSEDLAEARAAMERMERMIEDLLTLSTVGELVGDLEAVDLPALVEDCWRTVDTPAATLSVETERPLLADGNRLRQLLENLLGNAVEHAGPEVTVTVGAVEDGFYVADDGPGIPHDERETVFEPGYTSTDEGSGFGLMIAREIARAHGWAIRVTEREAGGARFEVTGVKFAD